MWILPNKRTAALAAYRQLGKAMFKEVTRKVCHPVRLLSQSH